MKFSLIFFYLNQTFADIILIKNRKKLIDIQSWKQSSNNNQKKVVENKNKIYHIGIHVWSIDIFNHWKKICKWERIFTKVVFLIKPIWLFYFRTDAFYELFFESKRHKEVRKSFFASYFWRYKFFCFICFFLRARCILCSIILRSNLC